MAGFQTAAMPLPQSRARPITPVVDIALVRPHIAAPASATPRKPAQVSPSARRMTEEQKALARQRAAEGVSRAAIAAEIGFGLTAIERATKGIVGAAAAAAMEANREVRKRKQAQVRALLRRRLSIEDIARELSITVQYVRLLRLSPRDYNRHLARMRKAQRKRLAARRRARRGVNGNFLLSLGKSVKAATGVSLADMRAPSDGQPRHPAFVRARQILCWLAVKHHGFPPTRVGAELGIDHTTVLHAVKTVQAVAEKTELPVCWKPLCRVVATLLDAMQRDTAERRQGLKARRTEIPTP